MAPETEVRHKHPMTDAARIPSAPLSLTLDEARTLRAACAGRAMLAPIVARLDVLLVALDERMSTLPPPVLTGLPDEHSPPWVIAMRTAVGAAVCIDSDCELSGGYAHVGVCEPCGCPKEHAIAECPLLRAETCSGCKGRGVITCGECRGKGCRR